MMTGSKFFGSASKRLGVRCGVAVTALLLAIGAVALPASAQDAADLLVRTTRLENQLRQLSGQIEQLQFENRRLSEQLRKFQEDVDFRMNEKGGGRSGGAAPSAPPAGAAPAPQRQRRGDAYDPTMQQGTAGTPQQLGGGIASIIEDEDGGG